jgi:hypothetical protein
MSSGSLSWAYKLLGLGPGASASELKRAYRRLAKARHPDAGGSDRAFQELQKAYETVVTSRSSQGPSRRPEPEPEPDDAPLSIGDWFVVRALFIDGRKGPPARAQLVVIEQEILVALYLEHPWRHASGSVRVFLSEHEQDREMAEYDRPVLQRATDLEGELTNLWFSPFEKRMRIDGYAVGEEPVEVEPNPAFRREPRSAYSGWWSH